MGRGGIAWELTELEWDVVVHNVPLVLDRVKARRLDWHDAQDARQEGVLGLARGVSKCDAERGTLSTVARPHIDSRITRERHRIDAAIHVPDFVRYKPDHPLHDAAKAVKAVVRLGGVDSDPKRPPFRLDENDDPETFAFDIVDPRAPDPAGETERVEGRKRTLAAVRRAVARLPKREREVVERRMRGELQRQIAESFGICRQGIVKLEARAHKRLRAALAEYA